MKLKKSDKENKTEELEAPQTEPGVAIQDFEDKEAEKEPEESENKPSKYGIKYPWVAYSFLIVGALSEVVDAMFMNATLETLSQDLNPIVATVISYIVGAGCFFSMAFVGFQLANRKYYSKTGERVSYGFWFFAGIALVLSKVLAGLVGGGLDEAITGKITWGDVFTTEAFISNAIIAMVQFVLYIGTGFMTRDAMKILTDNDMREYRKARKDYKEKLKELADLRGDVIEDISLLKVYPKYAERLTKSKRSVKKNITQYNEAARALVEARMAINVEPDLMKEMYNDAMKQEEEISKHKG